MESSFRISYEIVGGVPVLMVEGDMTSESDKDIIKVYRGIKEKYTPRNLIISFEKTNYINSSGIATLINMIQDIGEINGKISFVGLSDHFQKIMDIVGISDFVDIYNTEDDAILALKNPAH